MIKVTIRPYTKEEIELVKHRGPSLFNLIEDYFLFFIAVYIAFLSPLLLIAKFVPIPSFAQLAYVIFIVLPTVYAIRAIRRKYGNPNYTPTKKKGLVETLYVKTNRAIEREDIEDFGSSFYLDVGENGETKTLFLWGQYLDVLGEGKFPNTEFILERKADSKEFIELKLLGKYFKAEKLLPAFDKKLWKSGKCHEDGDIINKTLDEIM